MKILLTGSTGYIGKRLLPILLQNGHEVVCCVRDRSRFQYEGPYKEKVTTAKIDFLKSDHCQEVPKDIDAAYYLIHSMSTSVSDFESQESISAQNFKSIIESTDARQVIYLGGIINAEKLSRHLSSRKKVGELLTSDKYALTIIRAGIIVGSGSASFELIRDLVEKLPVMITPKWVLTKSQPIAIRDVISFLSGVLLNHHTFNRSFDIGGSNILSYKEMMLQFAEVRQLKRYIWTVPVMTPRLSSYWLYFVTSVSYFLAVNLVNSMKVEVLCDNDDLQKLLGIEPISYREAVERAFARIEQNVIISSWKDSFNDEELAGHWSEFIQVPTNGTVTDQKIRNIPHHQIDRVLNTIWSIGGQRGWYYGNWLWKIRGWMDRMIGGVGLRRGRRHPSEIKTGDALDFWRVLLADRDKGRLLLFAEMKLPGEAWLEFNLQDQQGKIQLFQTATSRPKGIFGRLYWYLVMPFHYFVFNGMINNILSYDKTN